MYFISQFTVYVYIFFFNFVWMWIGTMSMSCQHMSYVHSDHSPVVSRASVDDRTSGWFSLRTECQDPIPHRGHKISFINERFKLFLESPHGKMNVVVFVTDSSRSKLLNSFSCLSRVPHHFSLNWLHPPTALASGKPSSLPGFSMSASFSFSSGFLSV